MNGLDERPGQGTSAHDLTLALINILADFEQDRDRLTQAQRGTLNILEDFQQEKGDLRLANRAMQNILDDFDSDKAHASLTNGAVLNILDDFDAERQGSQYLNRAMLNILDDLEEERAITKTLNAELEHRVLERTAELTRSEERFRLLVEGVKDCAIFMLDPQGCVVTWNSGAERFKGYKAEEIIGRHFSCFYPPEDLAKHKPDEELARALANGSFEDDGVRIRKDGTRFIANVLITPVYDESGRHIGFAKITRDISERVAAQAQAMEALRREILLKEIHHRVKNNLQVVNSLLYLQSVRIADPTTVGILKESQTRVKSIALIHEKLYRGSDLGRVDFTEYARDLVADLFRTYGINQEAIVLRCDIRDVSLPIDAAIPCGLIINELTSNALKHAFPPGTAGEITITMARTDDDNVLLTVSDTGAGFPKDVNWRKSKSLGLNLVMDLTKQLGGAVEMNSDRGTTFKITFKESRTKNEGKA